MASQHIGLDYQLFDIGSRGYIRFNRPGLADNIGYITEITGLDSPEVRESAEDLVQNDGGVHGTFLHGRRTISITGVIAAPSSALDRHTKANLLSKATTMLRDNGELVWTDVDGTLKYVKARLQGPVKISGGWNKTFFFTLACNDPNIYAYTPTLTTIPYVNVTNLLLDPGAEVTPTTTHYAVLSSSGTTKTLSRAADPRPLSWGSNSAQLTTTGHAGPSANHSIASEMIACSPSSRLWCQTWGKAVTAHTNMQLYVEFYTSANAYITGSSSGTISNPITNGWHAFEAAVTSPSNAAKMRLGILAFPTAAGTATLRMDDSMIVQSPTYAGPHFHGGEPGARWNGTAGNSTSTAHGIGFVTNAGTHLTLPNSNLYGGLTNPRIVSMATGEQLWLNGTSIASGASANFNHRTHQITSAGVNLYKYLLPAAKQWWPIVPGINQIRFMGDGSPSGTPSLEITHNNAWI